MRKPLDFHSSESYEKGAYNIKNLIRSCDISDEEKKHWENTLDHKNALAVDGFEKLPSELKCLLPYIYESKSSLGNSKYLVPANVVKCWLKGEPLPEIKNQNIDTEFVPEILNSCDYIDIQKEIKIPSNVLSGLSRWNHFTEQEISVQQFVNMCIQEFINKDDVRRYLFSDKLFAETDLHKIKIGSRKYL